MHPDRERWNKKHERGGSHFSTVNARLMQHRALLTPGLACDLAMGAGQNAQWLESQGWRVIGLDLSDAAVARAPISRRVQADLLRLPLKPGRFDLVVCTFFLERALFPAMRALVRPGGTIFFETHDELFVKYKPDFPPQYMVRPGELLRAFEGLTVLHHSSGDDGRITYETIIVRKP